MTPEPTHRGMGHRIGPARPVHPDDEGSPDRSEGVDSSSTLIPAWVYPDGEVRIIGVRAEEREIEEQEEKEQEEKEQEEKEQKEKEEKEQEEIEEKNGSEKLPEEVSEWIDVHENVQSVPNANLPTIEAEYKPKAGVDLLVVVWFYWAGSGPKGGAPTLNGVAPYRTDVVTPAGALFWAGISVWKNPAAGTIKLELNENKHRTLFLPISVTNVNGAGGMKVGTEDDVAESANPEVFLNCFVELGKLGVAISCGGMYKEEAPAIYSSERTGTRILKRETDTAGVARFHSMEVCAAVKPASSFQMGYKWVGSKNPVGAQTDTLEEE